MSIAHGQHTTGSWRRLCLAGLAGLLLATPVLPAAAGGASDRIVLGSDGSLPCRAAPVPWETPKPDDPGRACQDRDAPPSGTRHGKGASTAATMVPTVVPVHVVVEERVAVPASDGPLTSLGPSDAERALRRTESAIRTERLIRELSEGGLEGVVLFIDYTHPGARAATAAERELDRVESLRHLDQLGGLYRDTGRTIILPR